MHKLTRVLTAWRATSRMPVLIRPFVQGAMVVPPFFMVLFVLPLFDWKIDGYTLTYQELWSSGMGAVAMSTLIPICAGAWGIALRIPRARWLIVAAPVVQCAILSSTRHPVSASDWLGVASASVLLYLGLFKLRAVAAFVHADKRA